MSEHIVRYWSASKGAFQAISEMHPAYLLNAEKRLAQAIEEAKTRGELPDAAGQPDGAEAVLAALRAEMKDRGIEPGKAKPEGEYRL